MPIALDPNGAPLRAKLEILNAHVGAYAIDIWDDDDRSGGPSVADSFVRRAKDYRDVVDFVALGPASVIRDKTVQFIWVLRKQADDPARSRVRIQLLQGTQPLAGFPKTLEVPFRDGQQHDIFQVWFFLVSP